MMISVALVNKKGGVGKSSGVMHLGGELATRGYRVLLVDIDPQASLSQGLLGPRDALGLDPMRTIAGLYEPGSMLAIRDIIVDVGRTNLALIPGHDNMTDVNWPRPWERGLEQFVLRDALEPIAGDFDIALFDLPPHIQLCAWSGLVAADAVVIPAQPEDYGIQGIAMILNTVDRAVTLANPKLKMLGILPTMVSNQAIHKNYLADLRDAYGADIFEHVIPSATDFKVAVTMRRSVVEYKPNSVASVATKAVANEMLVRLSDRCGWRGCLGIAAERGGCLMATMKEQMEANRAESVARKADAPTSASDAKIRAKNEGTKQLVGASRIEVGRIIRDANQPREEFDDDALEDLAESFRARGQLQPIRVRWNEEVERFIVVLGERRWRAAQIAGLTHLDCVVVSGNPTAEDLLEDQIIENALREDLRPVEQGKAYRRLMDSRGWSMRELAERLRVHFTKVQKACSLVELHPDVQELVDDGVIPASTGIILAAKIDDPAEQVALARQLAAEQPSRADTEAKVNRVAGSRPKPPSPKDKGRGAKAKPKGKAPIYPTGEWSDDTPTIKIIATGKRRRKFEGPELLAALEKAIARVRAEIGAEQGGEAEAA